MSDRLHAIERAVLGLAMAAATLSALIALGDWLFA